MTLTRKAAGIPVWILATFAFSGIAAAETSGKPIDFNSDIRPILSDKCFFCHGPDAEKREADLRLDVRDVAIETGAIKPSSPADSTLLDRIAHDDPDELMPPPRAKLGKLTDREIELLHRWIEQGAEYAEHWAFVPVAKTVAPPEVEDSGSWIRNEIDAFVLRQLRAGELEPAAEAPRERWLRRVTFDLTGLPPTVGEIDAFLADTSEVAFENVIDRLFESERYGERMANDWLDLARYADTFGYQADRLTHVWPWRDWVIRAFNDNLPYDDFITWQTAGDLLPNPTRDQILATAFNRLHRQTNEGGSINEEFRIEYVNDRVVTNGAAFLGLTLECSRCHDHKYDPISQRDYYSLSAFFNSIDESGLYSHFTETAPTPVTALYEGDQEKLHKAAREKVAELEKKLEGLARKARGQFKSGKFDADKISVPEPVGAFDFNDGKASGGNRSVEGRMGKAIVFSGDDPHTLGDEKTADFSRTDEFSFSLWLKPAVHKSRMVVFHRSKAAEDAAFRGFELMLYGGKPTFSLIHFWPGNAFRVQSAEPLPLNGWTHLTVTYDGSSRAEGVTIYRNGSAEKLEVVRDKLTRDVTHRKEWGDSGAGSLKLQLAGRFRDVGFGGGAIDEFQVFDRELTPLEVKRETGVSPVGAVTEDDQFAHFLLREDKLSIEARTALREAREEENAIVSGVRQIMVMRDLPEQRPAYVLYRGDYQQRRDEVGPGAPESVLDFSDDLPRNRLGFARWLTDERNPLTARVTVNRFWTLFFGRGLVGTPEDFGSQGERPTHPDLLDWLARDFIDSGWDVRKILKTIALSAAYRQDSIPAGSTTWSEDPENRWLARGPRHRLSAEQIRDNALAVSDLLVEQTGGPSVKPYELAASFKKQAPDKGAGLYRRSLYTFWKRTAPPPVMVTFDATAREVCTVKRESTATPLQALVLLNGPQYVEAARVLAERLLKEGGATLDEQIADGFRRCTSRMPEVKEVEILRQVYAEQLEHFRANAKEAAVLLKSGDTAADGSLDPVELAAMTVVCQTLLNFDECYTKR